MNFVWKVNQWYKKVTKVKFLFYAFTVFLSSALISACSNNPPPVAPVVNRIDLSKEITSAIKLLTTSADLSLGGIYIDGSQNTLIIAINSAQIVYADVTSTQDRIISAIDALNSAVVIFKTQKVTQIDPANLVSQWTFDQIPSATVGATVKDYSGNGHDGTIKAGHTFWGGGIPTLSTDRFGVVGKALHFDKGSNVEIPFSTAFNPPNFSISLWVNVDSNNPIANNQCMVSLNRVNCYQFSFVSSDFALTYNPIDAPGSFVPLSNRVSLAPNVWWHIVVTFGGGRMKFYTNAVLQQDWPNIDPIVTQSQAVNLVIGQDLPTSAYTLVPTDPHYLNSGGYFVGIIDEVRIYKSVLTPLQVSSIYSLERP